MSGNRDRVKEYPRDDVQEREVNQGCYFENEKRKSQARKPGWGEVKSERARPLRDVRLRCEGEVS